MNSTLRHYALWLFGALTLTLTSVLHGQTKQPLDLETVTYGGKTFRDVYKRQGVGRFRPGSETHPTIGTHGAMEAVEEEMSSVLVPQERLSQAVTTLVATHPYEVPAYEVIPIVMDHPTSGRCV